MALVPLLAGCAALNPFHPIMATIEVALAGQDIDRETECALGAAAARRLIDRYGLYRNPKAEQYLNQVGFALVAVTTEQSYPYSFAILDTGAVNAFACPGGPVFITRGLWNRLEDEAQLAGVLGHEIAHVVRRDAVEQARVANASAVALEATVGQSFLPLERMTDYVLDEVLLKGFSREQEGLADKLGTCYTAELGYYPYGLPDFLECAFAGDGETAWMTGSLFRTHPETRERVAALREFAGARYPGLRAAPRLRERLLAARGGGE